MKNRDVQVFLTIEEAETLLNGADPEALSEREGQWNIEKFWDGKVQIRQAIQNYYKEKKGTIC
jgi:hypothetical protein